MGIVFTQWVAWFFIPITILMAAADLSEALGRSDAADPKPVKGGCLWRR